MAGVAGGVQIGTMLLLSATFGLWEDLANLLGITAGIALNFFVNNLWTFRADNTDSAEEDPLPEAKPGRP